MNLLRLALAATLLLPVAAVAAPSCYDAVGDVRLADSGPAVDRPHVDLVDVDYVNDARFVVFVVRVVRLDAQQVGTWRVEFGSGRTRYYALGSFGGVRNPSDPDTYPGYRAGVVGGAATRAVGRLDPGRQTIWIYAPKYAFPGLTRIGQVQATARQTLLRAGDVYVSYVDHYTRIC